MLSLSSYPAHDKESNAVCIFLGFVLLSVFPDIHGFSSLALFLAGIQRKKGKEQTLKNNLILIRGIFKDNFFIIIIVVASLLLHCTVI